MFSIGKRVEHLETKWIAAFQADLERRSAEETSFLAVHGRFPTKDDPRATPEHLAECLQVCDSDRTLEELAFWGEHGHWPEEEKK
jgi:hypothetical protein